MLEDWFVDIPENADFYSHENQQFYVKVLEEFKFKTKKPIIFVPCASKKPISRSRTHCYLSPITRNPLFEIIIISEPQTIIPYQLEKYCPNYDYPPNRLNERDKWQLIRRLGIFLGKLCEEMPKRKHLFYIGGKHHFEILQKANGINQNFEIFSEIPKRGIRDYNISAKYFSNFIINQEKLM
jgi:predicted RNA-binding protein